MSLFDSLAGLPTIDARRQTEFESQALSAIAKQPGLLAKAVRNVCEGGAPPPEVSTIVGPIARDYRLQSEKATLRLTAQLREVAASVRVDDGAMPQERDLQAVEALILSGRVHMFVR